MKNVKKKDATTAHNHQEGKKVNKKFVLTALLLSSSLAHAWDFGLKADAQHASTNNVNLTNTAPIKDSYNTLSGYVQTKDDEFRFRLKGKYEKYQKQTENNNYVFDLSLQYKRTKTNEFTLSLFKQTYNGTPQVVTDTTSDNKGGKI